MLGISYLFIKAKVKALKYLFEFDRKVRFRYVRSVKYAPYRLWEPTPKRSHLTSYSLP